MVNGWLSSMEVGKLVICRSWFLDSQCRKPGRAFLFGANAVEEGRGSTEAGVRCLRKAPVFLVLFLVREGDLEKICCIAPAKFSSYFVG